MIGQTISHYRILEKLGEGGMGVVYRALDTRLRRTVAIKVLGGDALAHPERKQRFIQEARAASALNHPNIITIFEIDSAGSAEHPTEFIAMEYVSGHAMDSLIGRRGLPLEEVLRYAAEIASALGAAHQAGIVHRDIKPANIMIAETTIGGRRHVKVLDFGLAKLAEPALLESSLATETMAVPEALRTEEGTILGTVAYMSPEQAQGKKVDTRSDIFSFGSVLYEMVTGRRPFDGETKIATLSGILHKEPAPIAGLPAAAADLEKIIFRCLRKDPERRFQHMVDVKVALQEVREGLTSGQLATGQARTAPRRWHVPAVAGALLVLAAAIVGTALWLSRSPPQKELKLTKLTSDSGLTTDPAISADGKFVAYASDRSGDGNLDIYVQQIGSSEALRLTTHEADDSEPVFSPDGRSIAFHSERDGGGIYVVSMLGGGEVRRIADRGRRPQFSPDGNWIAYHTGNSVDDFSPAASKIYLVAPTGGPSRDLQREFRATRNPVWSPDAKHLLFYGLRDYAPPSQDTGDWWVAPAPGGPGNAALKTGARPLFRRHGVGAQVPGVWLPGNRIVFSGARGDTRNLWQVDISQKDWQITSPPERLTSGTGLEELPAGAGSRLVFASLTRNIDIWTVQFPAQGANQGRVAGSMQRLTDNASPDSHPALSSDGKKMVFRSNRSGPWEIWFKDLETLKETALTTPPGSKGRPAISADGSKVAYDVHEPNRESLYVLDLGSASKGIARPGGVRQVCEGCFLAWDWSSDGRHLLYWTGKQRVIGLLDVSSGEKRDVLQHAEYAFLRAHFSPDNRWVSFMGISEGFSNLFIAPFSGSAPPSQSEWFAVTDKATGDNAPRWSADGNLLYFTSDRDGFRCIWAQRLDRTTKKPVATAFEVYPLHSARRAMMDVPIHMIEISVARDKLVFPLSERTGNIWLAEP